MLEEEEEDEVSELSYSFILELYLPVKPICLELDRSLDESTESFLGILLGTSFQQM